MVKMVFELVGEGKGPQIVDWLSLTGRDRSQQAAGKAAKRNPEDDKDDDDMEGLDAPAAAGAEPTKPGGRTKDIYGDIISKWTNICQHEGTNYADDDGGESYYSDGGSDEYDAADDGLIDDTELVERFERRVTSKHEIDKAGAAHRFKIEENDDNGEYDHGGMDEDDEDDDEDEDEEDFENDEAQAGGAGGEKKATKRKRGSKKTREKAGVLDPRQVSGMMDEIEKFRVEAQSMFKDGAAPSKILPRKLEEPLAKMYKFAIDHGVILIKGEGAVEGLFDMLGTVTMKTPKSLLDKARKLSGFQQHLHKEMVGLEYIAAVVHQCRENNAQAAFDAGPEFVSFLKELFNATRNKGTPGQFKENLAAVLKKMVSVVKCMRTGYEVITRVALKTAGEVFGEALGGGGETAWLLIEDEVVKEEEKKQANEPLLRKYIQSYEKYVPGGAMSARPWAPRGYKALPKNDVIDVDALGDGDARLRQGASAPARHGGTDQSHVTGGGLSTAAGGSSALPHLTGTAPPYKGHVFDSIPEAPIPSFRNQPSSGGSSAAGSQQPLMATQEVPSVP